MSKKIMKLFVASTLFVFMVFSQGVVAASLDPADWFFIKVKTDNPGGSISTKFSIPTLGSGYNYDVDCDYENPGVNTSTGETGSYTCDYGNGNEGSYLIAIKPNGNLNFPRIYFNNSGDKLKITQLVQWGAIKWASMRKAFYGASNMIIVASDEPDFSIVSNMSHVFHGATLANPKTANWDMSAVTDMYSMFRGASSADPDTINWDVQNVQYMHYMFEGASSASPDTHNWNTQSVVDMAHMFDGAISANPDLRGWDVADVMDMEGMFDGVMLPTQTYDNILNSFEAQSLQSGVVFHGGNSEYCFGADARIALLAAPNNWTITQDGGNDCSISSNDFLITVKTDNMGSSNNNEFTIPTSGLGYNYNVDCDVSNAGANLSTEGQTGDYICQYGALGTYQIRIQDNEGDGSGFPQIYFNNTDDKLKILSLDQWGTGQWRAMSGAFYGAENMLILAQDLPDLSSVSNMKSMFRGALKADPNTTEWDVSSVLTMESMFRNSTSANPNVSQWDVSNVKVLSHMFDGAVYARPDVSTWNTQSLKDAEYMFKGVSTVNPDMRSWYIEAVDESRQGGGLFDYGFEGILQGARLPTQSYDALLIAFDSQSVEDDLRFDAGNSSYCSAAAITARNNLINTHNWTITDQGQDCSGMDDFIFVVKTDNPGSSNNDKFTIPATGAGYNYDVSCEDDGTIQWFGRTGSYTCGYPSAGIYRVRIIDASGSSTGFPRIFFNNFGDKLKIIDIVQWGTGSWTDMEAAFWGAENLALSARDTPSFSNVLSFKNMLRNAKTVSPDTTSWDTSNAQTMEGMFAGAEKANPDVSIWDVSQVTDMKEMFSGAVSANPDTTNWDIENVLYMNDMFNGVAIPSGDYDAMLIAFEAQNEKTGVAFHGGNSYYCDATLEKSALISNSSWQIQDLGQECTPIPPSFQPSQQSPSGDNTPVIKVSCAEVGNEINIYATTENPVYGSPYNNDLIMTGTCTTIGVQSIFGGPVVSDGYHRITYTESKYASESGHSPSFYPVIIDTAISPPISATQYPALIIPLGVNNEANFYLVFAPSTTGTVSFLGVPGCQNMPIPFNVWQVSCETTSDYLAPGYDENSVDIEVSDSNGNTALFSYPGLELGYPLTIFNGSNAGTSGSTVIHAVDTYVEIIADSPAAGQVFEKWTGTAAAQGYIEDIYATTSYITMPPAFIEATATYSAPYVLTVTSGEGGGIYALGTPVVITADIAPVGQRFDRWTGNTAGITNVNSASTTITMPSSNVSLTATYVVIGDCTGEGDVNIQDIVCAINAAANNNPPIYGVDIDSDSDVDIQDVVGIIDIVIN